MAAFQKQCGKLWHSEFRYTCIESGCQPPNVHHAIKPYVLVQPHSLEFRTNKIKNLHLFLAYQRANDDILISNLGRKESRENLIC
jgi:hypothetical protein